MRPVGVFGLLAVVWSTPLPAEQTWPCEITEAVRQLQTDLLPGSKLHDQRAGEIRAKLAEHPADPESLYLYGLSLMGPKTREAVTYFEKAAAADARFPWPRKMLAQIYSTQFKEPDKLSANLKAYSGERGSSAFPERRQTSLQDLPITRGAPY